ncbi:MAG: gamma-glutamyltransferase family protein [Mesosutterella sp.]|nr:gamma-glutamyltransferase family protein [Mesosutterella sp.]
MLDFDPLHYPYASTRSLVYSRNGMCCAGNPTAASAGLQTLLKGGNAVDAAIAMALTQPLAEPTGNGLGSDCFAIVWFKGRMYGINGSGPAPRSISIDALKERGLKEVPKRGVESIDVPGAVAAWCALHERFGSLELEEVAAPAVEYAEQGFPVSPNISRLWSDSYRLFAPLASANPAFQGWMETFAPGGRTPKAGEMFASPRMADTLRSIARTNGRSFYQGPIAEKIDAYMKRTGGFLSGEDLAAYKPEWVAPISLNYRGVDVWELPPNGHGITVLMALQILKGMELGDREDPETVHRQIDALKLAFSDTMEYVAEPACMKVSAEELLSEKYAAQRRSLIGERALDPKAGDPRYGSTVYFCTADRDGNMVSIIQSNFHGFGSGIVEPQTGVSFNDRAFNFHFDPSHPNGLKGGKRPYHTIIPGFLTQNGEALGPFGIMGGYMQPQAHVQFLMNLLDWKLNPQQALDAPRWQWVGGRRVLAEQDMPNALIRQLQRRGHEITVVADRVAMGRGQAIIRGENGVYAGGTEKRTDGQIVCY